MATSASTTKSVRTRKPRPTKAAAAPEIPQTPAPAPVDVPAPAEAMAAGGGNARPSLLSTIDLNKEFGIDGIVSRRDVFKYNQVKGGAYVIRHAIFTKLATATRDEIMGLTINQRKAAFSLIKGERQRYYGEAVRKITSAMGKAGEPLPKLTFESPIAAVSYGNAVRQAGANLRAIVFPAAVAPAVVDPALVAPQPS